MSAYKNSKAEINQHTLQDDGGIDLWKAAEEINIRNSLRLSYTERFRIMMRLMRIDHMLSRAKNTHKKMP